jgi:hypothetical protein
MLLKASVEPHCTGQQLQLRRAAVPGAAGRQRAGAHKASWKTVTGGGQLSAAIHSPSQLHAELREQRTTGIASSLWL